MRTAEPDERIGCRAGIHEEPTLVRVVGLTGLVAVQ